MWNVTNVTGTGAAIAGLGASVRPRVASRVSASETSISIATPYCWELNSVPGMGTFFEMFALILTIAGLLLVECGVMACGHSRSQGWRGWL